MEKIYKTGAFAKLADVSERTIRFYDQQGLLKPSFVMENGYRCYTEDDLMKIQKIMVLKYLGFALPEIKAMLLDENVEVMQNSIDLQIAMLDKKLQHMQVLKDTLLSAKEMMEKEILDWNQFSGLMQGNAQDEKIIDHYRNASNLAIRIQLHEMFSVNSQGWYPWLMSHIDFRHVNRMLEIGCGNGAFWKDNRINMRNREIFLSDISEGMVDTARNHLGDAYSFMSFDIQRIPFKKGYFDAVMANHMLFYVNDIERGIQEVARVLKESGVFYCSTYGEGHMQEITKLCQEFDDRITLSDQNLSGRFGLENAELQLHPYFKNVNVYHYEDALIIDEFEPLYEYVMSCHGNQQEILKERTDEFKAFLHTKVNQQMPFQVRKKAGLFICMK